MIENSMITATHIGLTDMPINGATLHDLTVAYHQYIAQDSAKQIIDPEPNYRKSLIMSFLWYRQCSKYMNGYALPFTIQQACEAVGITYEV